MFVGFVVLPIDVLAQTFAHSDSPYFLMFLCFRKRTMNLSKRHYETDDEESDDEERTGRRWVY